MAVPSSEVSVVGGGVVGLAVAVALRDLGIDVACFERSEPGQGQSAGRTRQFRHLHEDPALIELAAQARQGWLRWEQRFGQQLLGSEGALRAGADPRELDALRAAGVPAVALDQETARERFPIAAAPSGMLLWDPLAGAIRAAGTIAALSRVLTGALHRAVVRSIVAAPDHGSVELLTSAGVHRAHRCVVCAGAGTDRLVRPLGLDVWQGRQAHLRLSFRCRTAPSHTLPCFSDRRGPSSGYVYGLSDLGDRYAVGLAAVTTYPEVEDLAADVPEGIDVSRQRERILAYVRRELPGLDPQPVDEVLRLTTTLLAHPEDGFEVWHGGPLTAIAGPNLFKFAPLIGERLAEAISQSLEVSTARGTPAVPSR